MTIQMKNSKKGQNQISYTIEDTTWPNFMFLVLAVVFHLNSHVFLRKSHICEEAIFGPKLAQNFKFWTIHELIPSVDIIGI